MTGELVRRENGDTGRRMTCEDTETEAGGHVETEAEMEL